MNYGRITVSSPHLSTETFSKKEGPERRILQHKHIVAALYEVGLKTADENSMIKNAEDEGKAIGFSKESKQPA